MNDRVLRIAAGIAIDEAGRILLVRKAGTDAFMQPGGKLEPGEDGAACLCRELDEELGLRLEPSDLEYLGRFAAPAANEAGYSVDCDVYRMPAPAFVTVQAEIAEAVWFDRAGLDALIAGDRLAPLTRDNLAVFLGVPLAVFPAPTPAVLPGDTRGE